MRDPSKRELGSGPASSPSSASDEASPSAYGRDVVRLAIQRRVVQRKAERAAEAQARVAIPTTGGAPLDAATQARMGHRLGADLSGVRVHHDGASARAAAQLGARAFAVDGAVHFGAGEYAPGTREGDRLLAHELTHVVQGQRAGVVARKADDGAATDEEGEKGAGEEGTDGEAQAVSQPGDPAEVEADEKADAVVDAEHGDGNEHAAGAQPSAALAAPISKKPVAGLSRAPLPGGAAPSRNPAAPGPTDEQEQLADADRAFFMSAFEQPAQADVNAVAQRARPYRAGERSRGLFAAAARWAERALTAVDAAKARELDEVAQRIGELGEDNPRAPQLLDRYVAVLERSQPRDAALFPGVAAALAAARQAIGDKRQRLEQARARASSPGGDRAAPGGAMIVLDNKVPPTRPRSRRPPPVSGRAAAERPRPSRRSNRPSSRRRSRRRSRRVRSSRRRRRTRRRRPRPTPPPLRRRHSRRPTSRSSRARARSSSPSSTRPTRRSPPGTRRSRRSSRASPPSPSSPTPAPSARSSRRS